jgi:predicted TIM-barrel fold metal-dependent hydrolase
MSSAPGSDVRMSSEEVFFYSTEIAPHLPPAVLDFHAHVWRTRDWHSVPWRTGRPGSSYMVTEPDYPVESLIADSRRCFPDREYRAVCFGYPSPAADNEKDTAYVSSAGKRRGMYPLMVTGAELAVPQDTLRARMRQGSFLGYKVFLNWEGDNYGNKSVEDMLGPNEMDIAQELGLVVLLHVPRSGRLADPEVQRGVRRLSRQWPNASIVLAHCGRCYLPAEMEKAIGSVRDLPNVYMDTAMVMDELVLQMALDGIGPHRLLYATDFPVAAMRGRRVRVMDHWVDVVSGEYPASAFRVPAGGVHATFMALEIALALCTAGRRAGVSGEELRGVFFENGMGLLRRVGGGETVRRVEEEWGP